MRRTAFYCLALAVSVGTFAAGIQREKWKRLRDVPAQLEHFVAEDVIAGCVTLVAKHDRILALDAIGYANIAERRAMRADDLFWIASMTKPITAVAAMILRDEGKLRIDDPVSKHLPEFANMALAGDTDEGSQPPRRPSREITLRDLLTHTAGLSAVPSSDPHITLAELATAYSRAPLRFEPGSRWEYSNAGIDTLGRIVEVVSGMPYQTFLERRILKPLGMKDTTFWLRPRQAKRLATSYRPGGEGLGLEKVDIHFIQGELTSRARTPYPSGGLFSTASDVARFYQMMLKDGAWRNRRLLSSESVALMTRTQTGDLETGFTPGMSWGLGFAVVKEPQTVTSMVSIGTFGHGGAYGTQSWADPARDLILILMIQRAQLPNADASEIRQVFQDAVVTLLSE